MIFDGIVSWAKGVINKMISKIDLKRAIGVEVATNEPMVSALQLWSQMYENKADWLKENEVFSLNLPAAIAAEVSRAATLELEVEIEGSPRAEFLSEQFEKVLDKLRDVVEYGSAKGGLMFKPYVDGKDINVDYVQADSFYPVAYDSNGEIKAVVFVDQKTIAKKHYTRLEYHKMGDFSRGRGEKQSGCTIKNLAFKSDSKNALGIKCSLSEVEEWAELEEEATIAPLDKPLYAYFRYPLANNIDPLSPLGVSCYARAVELIKNADIQWSDFLWEFESGKRALYIDVLAFGKDSDGKPILPNKRLYRTIETGSPEGDMYHEWSPDFREASILRGLDAILKKIEFTCGIAYGTLSDPQTVDKTATEIKTSKQRTYATVVDIQKALQTTLDQLLYAMDAWASIEHLVPFGTYSATYNFDDSVLVDADVRFQQDLTLVNSRIMTTVEFRMRNFGEKEEVARAKIAEVVKEQKVLFEDEKVE